MKNNNDLIKWLEDRPAVVAKLKQMRHLEQEGETIEQVEFELLELAKGLAGASLEHFVQGKNDKALEQERFKGGGRIHG